MADVVTRTFDAPDEVVGFPLISTRIIELGDLTVGRRGMHELEGLAGEWRLAAFVGE